MLRRVEIWIVAAVADRPAAVNLTVDVAPGAVVGELVAVLADYLASFDPRIVGLSGTEQRVADAARSFKVIYRRVPLEGGGYTMDHSASVFLLNASGRFAGTLDLEESGEVALQKLQMLVARSA